MIPYGVSQLEHEGAEYRESEQDGHRIRSLQVTEAKEVFYKSEGSWGFVYVDGLPLAEIMFAGETFWARAGYSRADARRVARNLGAKFAEI